LKEEEWKWEKGAEKYQSSWKRRNFPFSRSQSHSDAHIHTLFIVLSVFYHHKKGTTPHTSNDDGLFMPCLVLSPLALIVCAFN
jgi:hypothetical protein